MTYFATIRGDGEAGDVYCAACASELDAMTVPMEQPPLSRACAVCGLTPKDYQDVGEVSC